jgi:hypothetical protein
MSDDSQGEKPGVSVALLVLAMAVLDLEQGLFEMYTLPGLVTVVEIVPHFLLVGHRLARRVGASILYVRVLGGVV